jgi:ABC-type transport system involved in multi-copper enzyme maturation permease subunit
MMKIWAIALNTFREALRDKVLYSLLFFSVLMIGFAVILDHLTVGERTKIIKDFGLASLSLFGILIAIFVGIGLVYKEIERKTIFNILSKPVRRYQFVIGKYLGLVITLFVVVALMTILFLTLLYLYVGETDFTLLYAIGMSFLELMVITAFAVLFSSFSTPILSGFFTLSFVVIGHLTSDLKALGENSLSLGAKYITQAIYVALPNLELFNLKGAVVYQMPIEKEYLYYATCYGLLYTLFILGLAVIIFQKRDFR